MLLGYYSDWYQVDINSTLPMSDWCQSDTNPRSLAIWVPDSKQSYNKHWYNIGTICWTAVISAHGNHVDRRSDSWSVSTGTPQYIAWHNPAVVTEMAHLEIRRQNDVNPISIRVVPDSKPTRLTSDRHWSDAYDVPSMSIRCWWQRFCDNKIGFNVKLNVFRVRIS